MSRTRRPLARYEFFFSGLIGIDALVIATRRGRRGAFTPCFSTLVVNVCAYFADNFLFWEISHLLPSPSFLSSYHYPFVAVAVYSVVGERVD